MMVTQPVLIPVIIVFPGFHDPGNWVSRSFLQEHLHNGAHSGGHCGWIPLSTSYSPASSFSHTPLKALRYHYRRSHSDKVKITFTVSASSLLITRFPSSSLSKPSSSGVRKMPLEKRCSIDMFMISLLVWDSSWAAAERTVRIISLVWFKV